MLPVALACMGLLSGCAHVQPQQESLAWSEDDTLRLDLSVVAVPEGKLQRTQLRLTATNTSTNSIVLDKEMLAGFCLRFRTDLTEEPLHSDARDVSTREVARLDKPLPTAAAHRFVALKPGDKIARTYDLSQPMKTVCEGHMSDQNSVHYGFYYEALTQFVVPERAEALMVDAWYERGVWMMSVPQFEEWHGKSPEEIGLWGGRARSETITVKRTSDGRRDASH